MNFAPQKKSLRASSASSAPPRSRPPSCRRVVVTQLPPRSKICCASPSPHTPSAPKHLNPLDLQERDKNSSLRRCAKKPAHLPQKSAQVRKLPPPATPIFPQPRDDPPTA